ncbi:TetR/AcrR family transcriptional regulator [Chimaeribacter arupi]|uniref:TetR/AcrR family transcriptional regulator n=1 Tax=Chimaeribacter arupi TaxID=2060066 RepID=A0A2N5EHE9_9GAMM|nr:MULTISPECIES: TetR/AcrR family transcriptional regulator [Yersiniaceae]MDV5141966.1 TetR/AcrR family transcriptional regulator [Chimaeribacter arupi]PLR31794.1 TetR/AcrR family transcriptional regulator [Chimaeribacter arupi]PLR43469.1 TetR/AcrR family transcriptional regulator [Chimaeribacter arupi]PLR46980.1 TetR/AcrR family transcriptional regulator [Chimaeribacter arupi]PLR53823.1 TetR/AcrR family transcriptional regulator [Chimaeribacter arupi]
MNKTTAHKTAGTQQRILETGNRIMAAKGFSAVGLNEILTAASVPKGSFYNYFSSKEAFGEALLDNYFEEYLADMDALFSRQDLTAAQRLLAYFQQWRDNQSFEECQGKCLAVKLGAEVADLSEAMRTSLQRGTEAITRHMAEVMKAGISDGSLHPEGNPDEMAQSLYQLWLGASVMVKISRNTQPFDAAMAATRQWLNLPPQ